MSQSPIPRGTLPNITAGVLAVVLMAASAGILGASTPMARADSLTVAASPPLNSGEQPVAGEITSLSGLGCMDNKGGNDPLNGSTNPVQLSSCNGAANTGSIGKQLWTVEPDSTIRMFFQWDPTRALSSPAEVATGPYECLRADTDSTVGLWECNGSNWEDWTFQVVTGNEYVLKVTGQFSSAGTTVTKCLAEKGSGAQLAMVSCDPTAPSQQWDIPANTTVHQAAPAMLALNSYYDKAGGLFVDPSGSSERCTQSSKYNYVVKTNVQEYGGNCWWWAANALYSMVDFLEHAGSAWLGSGSISDDISNTYHQICYNANNVNTCPTNPLGNQDLSLTNPFQNNYFDDTANWALFWLNAYEYTVSQGSGDNQYLYLAENLWHYITQYGWDLKSQNNSWTCGYPGGIVQSYFSPDPAKNLGVNSLYLRLSAWLYVATGNTTFRDGIPNGSTSYGGYAQEANWLFPTSPVPKSDITLFDSSGFPAVPMPLIFYGEIDPQASTPCTAPAGRSKEAQHEGMMIGALVDLYQAGLVSGGQLNYAPSFYLTIADNLAETMMTDYASSPTFQPPPPSVTDANVLNESGDSFTNPTNNPWGDEITGSEAWIPGKGIFMRNLYCLNTVPIESSALPSGKIGTFIDTSASSIVQNDQNLKTDPTLTILNYNEFGYWWQGDPYTTGDGPLSFQADLSAAEPIAADLNTTATAMC